MLIPARFAVAAFNIGVDYLCKSIFGKTKSDEIVRLAPKASKADFEWIKSELTLFLQLIEKLTSQFVPLIINY
jgi:hypothetical protein